MISGNNGFGIGIPLTCHALYSTVLISYGGATASRNPGLSRFSKENTTVASLL